jgi:hypothetical protein
MPQLAIAQLVYSTMGLDIVRDNKLAMAIIHFFYSFFLGTEFHSSSRNYETKNLLCSLYLKRDVDFRVPIS